MLCAIQMVGGDAMFCVVSILAVDKPLTDMTPEEMIATILEPGFKDDSGVVNALLSHFYSGFPIENLLPLLTSDSEEVKGCASFLASELTWKANPFVAEIAGLLDSQQAHTRFEAIEALVMCTTPDDGWALGRVLLRLDDPHGFVRFGVMNFIRISHRWQLISALNHAAKEHPGRVFAEIRKLFRGSNDISAEAVRLLIEHEDPIAQRFGVAIAARPRLVVDESFLDIANTSVDPELQKMAAKFRDHILPPWAILSSTFTD